MANDKRYLVFFAIPPDDTEWTRELDFLKIHPEYLAEGNAMGFISDNGGEEFNLCHCGSPILV